MRSALRASACRRATSSSATPSTLSTTYCKALGFYCVTV